MEFHVGVLKPKMKDVFTPDVVLKYQAIPADVGELEYFFIIVTEAYSPGRFYFFLRKNRAVIETLTDDMKYHKFYMNDSSLGGLLLIVFEANYDFICFATTVYSTAETPALKYLGMKLTLDKW